jgi:diguanylate cyclase (GGDEF)-like protein
MSHWAFHGSQRVTSLGKIRSVNEVTGSTRVLGAAPAGSWFRFGFLAPRSWALWQLPAPTRVLVLLVTALAAGSGSAAVWVTRPRGQDLLLFAVLLGAAAVSVEATRRIPEPAGMNANDMLGAWWIAIAALLPPVYALLAPVPVMALLQWRVRRSALFKAVYSTAAIGLAHAAASVAFHALPGGWTSWALLPHNPVQLTLALLATAVLAKTLNAGLVGLAVKTADPEARWATVFVVDHGQLEITEVCAGVLSALTAGLSPILVLVGLPPVLLAQRGMLYAQLNAAARTDTKTGLLNAVTWEREAAAELSALRRRGQPAAVLLVDIDHFKHVNDTHGHLAGDDVLRRVADVLRAQLRNQKDLICRFGGEEFAVFLPGLDALEAPAAAERLRRGVAELVTPVAGTLVQITVSVGVSVADPVATPDASVPELLAGADLGLYQAKGAGRDQVRLLGRPDRRTRHT